MAKIERRSNIRRCSTRQMNRMIKTAEHPNETLSVKKGNKKGNKQGKNKKKLTRKTKAEKGAEVQKGGSSTCYSTTTSSLKGVDPTHRYFQLSGGSVKSKRGGGNAANEVLLFNDGFGSTRGLHGDSSFMGSSVPENVVQKFNAFTDGTQTLFADNYAGPNNSLGAQLNYRTSSDSSTVPSMHHGLYHGLYDGTSVKVDPILPSSAGMTASFTPLSRQFASKIQSMNIPGVK